MLFVSKEKGVRSATCAYLGGLVLGGSDEVGAVGGELDVVDLVVELVGLDVLQLLTGLSSS